VEFPDYWLFFLGALFIVVTLFFPQGVVGAARNAWGRMRKAAP
jgi:urea transport system permease protein